MLHQGLKDLYFILNRWIVMPSTGIARLRFARRRGLLLHLGCGDHYIPGMTNIDGNLARRKDLWLDLRNPLPFADGSADLVYCCHTLEHLFPDEALRLLAEIRRVLAPGCTARIAVPSLEFALEVLAGRKQKTWPRSFEDAASQALNYLFCDGQHKYGYAFETLSAFARQAGFRQVVHFSSDHGVQLKRYGAVELGNEPEGSLVVELSS